MPAVPHASPFVPDKCPRGGAAKHGSPDRSLGPERGTSAQHWSDENLAFAVANSTSARCFSPKPNLSDVELFHLVGVLVAHTESPHTTPSVIIDQYGHHDCQSDLHRRNGPRPFLDSGFRRRKCRGHLETRSIPVPDSPRLKPSMFFARRPVSNYYLRLALTRWRRSCSSPSSLSSNDRSIATITMWPVLKSILGRSRLLYPSIRCTSDNRRRSEAVESSRQATGRLGWRLETHEIV